MAQRSTLRIQRLYVFSYSYYYLFSSYDTFLKWWNLYNTMHNLLKHCISPATLYANILTFLLLLGQPHPLGLDFKTVA